MTYLSLGLRVLLSIAFLGAGGAKLLGVEMMVETYDTLGLGQGLRYVTAFVEILGVALLWLPNRQAPGAALLGATMIGAALAHWLILGPSAVPAVVLGIMTAVVLYLHRAQIPAYLHRA